MEDLLKRIMYTGVGLVTTTAEKFQETIDELVEKGSLSTEEGKKVVDDLLENTEARKEEFEGKIKELVDDVMDKLQLPSNTEFQGLIERIKKLEAKLGIDDQDNIMKG